MSEKTLGGIIKKDRVRNGFAKHWAFDRAKCH